MGVKPRNKVLPDAPETVTITVLPSQDGEDLYNRADAVPTEAQHRDNQRAVTLLGARFAFAAVYLRSGRLPEEL